MTSFTIFKCYFIDNKIMPCTKLANVPFIRTFISNVHIWTKTQPLVIDNRVLTKWTKIVQSAARWAYLITINNETLPILLALWTIPLP
jgi:hypothetical protein